MSNQYKIRIADKAYLIARSIVGWVKDEFDIILEMVQLKTYE